MMNQQSSACYLILIHCDLSFVQLDVAVLVAAQELPRGLLQPACFACEHCFFGLGWLIFNILAHVEGKKKEGRKSRLHSGTSHLLRLAFIF